MKSVVKAQSLAALDKPPYTSVVAEDEITFKQELRSSKPEIAYYISDEDKLRKKFNNYACSSAATNTVTENAISATKTTKFRRSI